MLDRATRYQFAVVQYFIAIAAATGVLLYHGLVQHVVQLLVREAALVPSFTEDEKGRYVVAYMHTRAKTPTGYGQAKSGCKLRTSKVS